VNDFQLRAAHLTSADNRISDYLSRWHLDPRFKAEFFSCVSDISSLKNGNVSVDYFKFLHDW
jgi:hypothetical protein